MREHREDCLKRRLYEYVSEFNQNDPDNWHGAIANEAAYDFLVDRIPLVDLPDRDIERVYYFRWWTYRKHVKKTETGYVVTEFLPDVPWAGTYNTINCAASFHIREGRWMRDSKILPDYIDFWLSGRGKPLAYSWWFPEAVREYCEIQGNEAEFTARRLDGMLKLFYERLESAKTPSGLYFSDDGNDGMERSISGSGLRPTLNSYLIADARALARFCRLNGREKQAEELEDFAGRLRENMLNLLWDGDFFKVIPQELADQAWESRPAVSPEKDVREQLGYIPWYFDIPDIRQDVAWEQLMKEDGFFAPFGLTTAERRHPGFMGAHEHECLWNGPVWPYATTQTLVGLANALRRPNQTSLTANDYYTLLRQYARSHRRTLPDGREADWVDENMHPDTGEWLARSILESWGWRKDKGGYERGRDYNHSMFCDLVLSGLLGVGAGSEGELRVRPMIPDEWTYFRVRNLYFRGKLYDVTYDKDGSRYGAGVGLWATESGAESAGKRVFNMDIL